MKTNILICIIALFIFSDSNAQKGRAPRFCVTDSMWNEAVKTDPSAAQKFQLLKDRIKLMQLSQQRMQSSPDDTVLFTIPVVFHVIHTYGSDNISKAQIVDAVDILNKSYQKLNNDTGDVIPLFQPIFANCQIRFRLANIDPDGNCTDGITRTYSKLTNSAGDNVKDLVDWPASQYLNIWVVNNIASGAAGYAYYPGISPNIDGVVILNDYVGSIGTADGSNYSSRSLAHEVGHWLSLPHTWGSTNTPGVASNCGIDDGILDTPNTVGVGNFTCNTSQSTCGEIDNVQNYMDYASCHKMFTDGQKDAMQTALNSSIGDRDFLWDPLNLVWTGTEDGHVQTSCTPVADISDKVVSICTGSSASFKDESWNGDVISRLWQFPGGTPSTDTSATPDIIYNTPGIYDVTLTATTAGGSSTITRTAQVHVSSTVSPIVAPASEGFETANFASTDWIVINQGNNNVWNITSAAAATGVKSAELTNYNGNVNGDDVLITPGYNLSNLSAAQLTFKVAYASKSTPDNSALAVSLSNNCGETWTTRYRKVGATLQTTTNSIFPNFIPNSSQWRTETVNLSSITFSGQASLRVKFEFTNDGGNNIYIDDINISGVVGMNEILAQQYNFQAWPNPSSSVMHIRLDRTTAESVQLELYDALGRKIESLPGSSAGSGAFETDIVNKGYSGMYILKVKAGDKTFQQRIMFID